MLLPTDLPGPFSQARRRGLIAGLSFTQMTAWGTTFYLPSVVGARLGVDVSASPDWLFGGVTVMLLISAFLSPAIGRHIDAHGARLPMAAGSVLLAAGLVVLSLATGPWSYLAAFAMFGFAVPLAMSNAGFAAVAQASPGEGRKPISLLMLVSGLASGVYWPITGLLEAELGWRGTALVFAGLHLFVCLPLHLALVRRPAMRAALPVDMPADSDVSPPRAQPLLPEHKRMGFIWIVLGAGVSGLASWGMPLQFIPMFESAGLATAAAIALASLQSPASMAARALDIALAGRVSAVRLVVIAALGMPVVTLGLALALKGAVTPNEVGMIGLCIALYGVFAGLISMARSTLPLELFGAQGYATLLGRMSFFLNILFALSPLVFAWLRHAGGPQAVLLAGFAMSALAALAFIRLERLASARGGG